MCCRRSRGWSRCRGSLGVAPVDRYVGLKEEHFTAGIGNNNNPAKPHSLKLTPGGGTENGDGRDGTQKDGGGCSSASRPSPHDELTHSNPLRRGVPVLAFGSIPTRRLNMMGSRASQVAAALTMLLIVAPAHAADKVTLSGGGTWRLVYMDKNYRTEGFYDGEVSSNSYPDEESCLIAGARYASLLGQLASDYSHPEKLKAFEQRMSDMGLMPDAFPSCAYFISGPWKKLGR